MKKIISIALLSLFAASVAQADMLVCNMQVETVEGLVADGIGSDGLPLRGLLKAGDYTCSVNVESQWVMEMTLSNDKRGISRFTRNQPSEIRIEDKKGNVIENAKCDCKFR